MSNTKYEANRLIDKLDYIFLSQGKFSFNSRPRVAEALAEAQVIGIKFNEEKGK